MKPINFHAFCGGILLTILFLGGCSSSPSDPVVGWFKSNAVPIKTMLASEKSAHDIDHVFQTVRVVALGEATHGQHESFELKRAITMHLIRDHGYRLVAYEASASSATACEKYVSGQSDDLTGAVSGLGMLIWSVEENASLLKDLRAWNAAHSPADQVHFAGVDVQDTNASARRLSDLLQKHAPELGSQAIALANRVEPAVKKLWSGDAEEYKTVAAETDRILDTCSSTLPIDLPNRAQALLHAREFRLGIHMFWSLGGRDLALAEMLHETLALAKPGTRAVVWAHNAHILRGQLRYLNSEELAMGGHVASKMGDQYYAIGFAFNQGDFVALDRDDAGRWGFRTYAIDAAPPGSLEWPIAQALIEPSIINLRAAPKQGPVHDWFAEGHGQRWFGGYNVSPDYRVTSRDATKLLPTFPLADYDAIIFIPQTTATHPIDTSRILPPVTTP